MAATATGPTPGSVAGRPGGAARAAAVKRRRSVKRRAQGVASSAATGSAPQSGGGSVEYVARRPLKVGQRIFQPGEVVPGAESWPRVEGYIRTGRLDRRPVADVG